MTWIARRGFLFGGAVLLVARAGRPAVAADSPAHRRLADALFELYLSQSVRLSIVNAARQRPPGTAEVLMSHAPAMMRQLERHRAAFGAAMARALAAQVSDAEVAGLLASVGLRPPTLSEAQRQKLIEADAEFRRESQAVIGAITADIALLISATLSEAVTRERR